MRSPEHEPNAPRYAVITFDDGYRDVRSVALPFLEQHKAPFTVYVPTDAPTCALKPWWLGLRELFRRADQVTIDPMDAKFDCPDFLSKRAGLKAVTQWVHEDYRRVALLEHAFRKYGISLSALNDAYFLNEGELLALSRHPLASIGGHTTSHAALATLDSSLGTGGTGRQSQISGKVSLSCLFGTWPIPMAVPARCGPREWRLAEQAGFSTAVTTRKGHLGDGSLNRFGLPRIGVGCHSEARIPFEANASGVHAAARALTGVRPGAARSLRPLEQET